MHIQPFANTGANAGASAGASAPDDAQTGAQDNTTTTPKEDKTKPYQGGGLMMELAKSFEEGGAQLFAREAKLRKDLATTGKGSGTTNPTLLAEYQAAVSELNILRNAQSSSVKAYKDMDATIVANFR